MSTNAVANPTALITYAHESQHHKDEVRRLAELLVANGVRTELDQWAEGTRQDWGAWAHKHITESDYTLVVASPMYKAVGDGNGPPGTNRGVQAEAALLRELHYRDRDGSMPKILPVILPGRSIQDIPDFLQPHCADHYLIPELTTSGVEDLLRVITRQPKVLRPTLGSLPILPPHVAAGPMEAEVVSATEPEWRVLPSEAAVTWRNDIVSAGNVWVGQWPGTMEVHLVPVDGSAALPLSRMRKVGEGLASFARVWRLVSETEQVNPISNDDIVWVDSGGSYRDRTGGMAILRNGQRSAWLTLPDAQIGNVLIRTDAINKMSGMLSALVAVEAPLADEYVPTAGIDPAGVVRVGEPHDLTSRTASFPLTALDNIRLPAEESLRSTELVDLTSAVAEELVERLISKFPKVTP